MEEIIIRSDIINNEKIELSIFDGVFINMKFIYEFSGKLSLDKFKTSLLKTLNEFLFIGGKLKKEDDTYFIDISNPFIKLIICNDENINISTDNDSLFIVLLKNVNLNIFTLELYINHIIGDGRTINNILKTWSDIYQEKYIYKKNNIERYKPISSYKNIKNIKEDKTLNLYKIFNFQDMEFIINSPKLYKYTFKINIEEIKILKKISNSYSSLDSISSYLFNVCRDIEKNKVLEHICTSVDFRKKVNISTNTIGNYIMVINTEKIKYDDNSKNNNLKNTSQAIRSSINNLNTETLDKCGNNIEYERRNGNFENYTFNIKSNYFITDSWTTFDISSINFGLTLNNFIPPSVPIPYLTLYMKEKEDIMVHILIPEHLKYTFENIINKDKKELFKDYY